MDLMEDSKIIKLILKLSSWCAPRKKILLIMYLTYVYIPVRKNLLNYTRPRTSNENCSNHNNNNNNGDDAIKHRRIVDGIVPEVNKLGYGLYIMTTCVHVYCVLGGLVLIYVEHFSPSVHVQSVACYLPRLAIHEGFGVPFLIYTSFQFSLMHLLWRYSIWSQVGRMRLDSFVFLLIDEQHLVQNAFLPDSPLHELVQVLLFYRTGYKMNMVSKHYLRPNRLLRKRRLLLQTLEIFFTGALLMYITSSLVFSVVCSRTSLFHLDALYPNCDLSVIDSSYLFRFITSALLTSVFLFDTLVGTVVPHLVGVMLIFDLNNYWRYIEKEIGILKQMIETPETLSDRLAIYGSTSNEQQQLNKQQQLQIKSTPTSVVDKLFRPDRRSYDLQVMICDFFAQLQDADRYVSSLIAFALYIWVGTNATFTFTGIQQVSLDRVVVFSLVRGVQIGGLFTILALSQILLDVKDSTERAYRSLCSIMAHDRSLKKTRWLSILEYYIGKPRYAFTFQQSKIFTMATLVRFLSYTFTFIFLIQSLRPQ